MSIFEPNFGLALVLAAALCLGGRTPCQVVAQAAPVTYWTPGWPVGSGNPAPASSNSYGNFPSFDGSDARGGISRMRYNFGGGWFVGSEGGVAGLNMNGINQFAAFGSAGSLNYQSVQFGYNFQNAPRHSLCRFRHPQIRHQHRQPVCPLRQVSGTLPGYSARAGVEFQPTSNLSLSFGVGYTNNSPGASIATSIRPCYPALLRLPSAVAAHHRHPSLNPFAVLTFAQRNGQFGCDLQMIVPGANTHAAIVFLDRD